MSTLARHPPQATASAHLSAGPNNLVVARACCLACRELAAGSSGGREGAAVGWQRATNTAFAAALLPASAVTLAVLATP